MDTMEESILTNIISTFFSASTASMERRAASIGPGSGDHAFDGRSDSRGRSARRATSMMPSRDTSHGRAYASRDSAFHEDEPLANVAEETYQVPLHTLSRIASSTDVERMGIDHHVPPVRPGESAPAYEAVPSAPSSPSVHPTRPTINGRGTSVESFDLSRALRNPALQGPQRLDGSPTPSRSPLGRTSPRTAPSSPSNGDVTLLPLSRSTTGHSRLSQESNPSSDTGDSHTPTDSRDISTASSIVSTDESANGWNSAPVLGANYERGRPTTRDDLRVGADEEGGHNGASTTSLDVDGSAPSFQTRASNRQSPSPAGFSTSANSRPSNRSGSFSTTTGSRRRTGSASSSTTTGPPPTALPSALRNKSASSSARSGTSKSRFSLAGLSDALRGKSTSRAREESSSRPSSVSGAGAGAEGRRATSPDTRKPHLRDQSRGRKTALKVLRDALTSGGREGHGGGGDHSGSDEEGEGHATGWKEFRAGTYTYPISIAVPASLPPTISADFGHVSYSLKATIYRAGALTPNLSTSTEIILVSAPGQDDTEENESIVVERFWETQMKYHVALSGKVRCGPLLASFG